MDDTPIPAPEHQPAPPDSGQWLAASSATFNEAYGTLLTPPRVRTSALLLVGTLSVFLLADVVQGGSWRSSVWLVAVLLVHEGGHFAGMRWYGYQDVRMFFIPLMGAAVAGRPTSTSAWNDGVVTLLGPLPGIALGLGLAFGIAGGIETPWVHQVAWMLVAINGFNLLPLGPLDGGRLFQGLIYSRHRYLEFAAGLAASLLFIALSVWLRTALMMLLGIWVLGWSRARYRAGNGVAWLRRTQGALPSDPSALDADQRFALFTAAYAVVPDGKENDAASLSGAMQMMLEGFRPRPSLPASLALLGAWTGGLLAAVAAAGVLAVMQPAAWAVYACPEMGVSAEFPGEPTTFPRENLQSPLGERPGLVCSAAHRASAIYSIVLIMAGDTVDEPRRRAWLSSLGPDARTGAQVRADGMDAIDVEYGSPTRVRSRVVFAGSMVFELSASGASPEDASRFIDSFHRTRR